MSLATPDTMPALEWATWRTRYLFFTGKGGVGKTTIASAVAVALADAGKRTLVISTDPASNLDDVFGIEAGPQPTAVPAVARLFVSNIDPEAAAEAFKQRAVDPYRGVLPASAVRNMEEQLSGACTVEIAAFNEFTAVLAAPRDTSEFDHVVFDTAPTGHTMRLLTLPSAWSGYVAENPAGSSCLGPLAGLDHQREQYATAVATLADPALTTLVLVSRAEPSALREAARASGELGALGVANQRLIINGLLHDPEDDPTALAFTKRQAVALGGAPERLAMLPVAGVDLVAGDVTGLAALRQLTDADATPPADGPGIVDVDLPDLSQLVDELDAAGNGVVMTMGKGGVGKTTLAAAIAIALVDRGHEVTLSTTDTAAHITDALADAAPQGLMVERIDPAVETARYSDQVLAAATGLDPEGRALLQEDLRSPCTEEIAVFRAFARTVDCARERIVVLDTAPTGHTLLLLDAAQSYQREVKRTNADVPRSAWRRSASWTGFDSASVMTSIRANSGSRRRASSCETSAAPRRHRTVRLDHQRVTGGGCDHAPHAACPRRRRAHAHRTHPAVLGARNVAGRLAAPSSGRGRRAARTHGRRCGARTLMRANDCLRARKPWPTDPGDPATPAPRCDPKPEPKVAD